MNLSELHKIGIIASIGTDGGLLLDAPKGVLSQAVIDEIRHSKPALLAEIRGQRELCEHGELCSLCIRPPGKGINPAGHLHKAETPETHHPEITPEPLSTAAPTPIPEPTGYSLPTIADIDDRRTCRQCMNLRGRVCGVASPGGIVSANRGYTPEPDTMQRCNGYQPTTTDNDQRPGAIRWPSLNVSTLRNTK